MHSRLLGAAITAVTLLAAPVAHGADTRSVRLPPAAGAVSAASALTDTWLVGAQPGAVTQRIARRHGASALKQGTAYEVSTKRARAFAAALRRAGRLTYAEPNVDLRRQSALDSDPTGGPRQVIVPPGLAPPAPSATSSIAIIDDRVDTSLPDLHGNTTVVNPGPVLGPHGTMVASTAAGAFNGSGVFGIFPGAPLLSIGMPLQATCADGANGVITAARAKARVINLSFGTPSDCGTLFDAVQKAYASGSLVVASAGNEGGEGNPVIYPAAYPHVLSVAALDPTFNATEFSNRNTAVDVAAPGVGVPVAIPLAFDTDGTVDGITIAAGTSFSAPMVAGAASWLATARPALKNGQLADILRHSALDVGTPGYDPSTGFGLIRMPAALAFPTPDRDVLEPNDGITFVNGAVFGTPDPFLWRGGGKRNLKGSADQVEDPLDVYRIRLAAKSRARIRLRPYFGDPNLFIFRGTAKSIRETNRIVARSLRTGSAIDSVTLRNTARVARTFYVAISVSNATGTGVHANYRLELQRLKR
jgi:hypothetical protein